MAGNIMEKKAQNVHVGAVVAELRKLSSVQESLAVSAFEGFLQQLRTATRRAFFAIDAAEAQKSGSDVADSQQIVQALSDCYQSMNDRYFYPRLRLAIEVAGNFKKGEEEAGQLILPTKEHVDQLSVLVSHASSFQDMLAVEFKKKCQGKTERTLPSQSLEWPAKLVCTICNVCSGAAAVSEAIAEQDQEPAGTPPRMLFKALERLASAVAILNQAAGKDMEGEVLQIVYAGNELAKAEAKQRILSLGEAVSLLLEKWLPGMVAKAASQFEATLLTDQKEGQLFPFSTGGAFRALLSNPCVHITRIR